ncbi:MAG: hypothetical protein O7F76_07435, partial [Planctomycetota bacterium]|nr:hypothetical protein [Planctomycetota bacterium]
MSDRFLRLCRFGVLGVVLGICVEPAVGQRMLGASSRTARKTTPPTETGATPRSFDHRHATRANGLGAVPNPVAWQAALDRAG